MKDTTIEVIVSYKMAANFSCDIVIDKEANRLSDRVDATTSSAGSKAKCSGPEEFY